MPAVFKHISQVVTWADYQKLLRKAMADVPPEREPSQPPQAFHYFESFPFDQKPGTALLLVGEVSKGLLDEVRRLAGKTDRAQGSLRFGEGRALSLQVDTGRVKPRLVAMTLKQAGVLLEVRLEGEPPAGPPQDAPAAPVPQTPVSAQPAPLSPQAQDWADKLQKFEPHYHRALQGLRSRGGVSRTESLEALFRQMAGQAESGDWTAARDGLRQLVLAVQGVPVEASQAAAEATPMQDAPVGGGEVDASEPDPPESLTAAEWKEQVCQSLQALQSLTTRESAEWAQVTANDLRDPLVRIENTLRKAQRLAPEIDRRYREQSSWWRAVEEMRELLDQISPQLWDLRQDIGEYSARPAALGQQIRALGQCFEIMVEAAALDAGPARRRALELRLAGLSAEEERLRESIQQSERQQVGRSRQQASDEEPEAVAEQLKDLRDALDRTLQAADALKLAIEEPPQLLDATQARALQHAWEQAAQEITAKLQAQDYPAVTRALENIYPPLMSLGELGPDVYPSSLVTRSKIAMDLLMETLKLAERTAGFSWRKEQRRVIRQLERLHLAAVLFGRECLQA